MYVGQIYKAGNPITVAEAVNLGLITVDENGDVWLASDAEHRIKITGDLRFQ